MSARIFHNRLTVWAVLLLLAPVPGTVSGWEPVAVSVTSVIFPSGGGNASVTLRLPADGLVKGFNLNVTGQPVYANYTYSADADALWGGERRNLSLANGSIGLGGFGSWWEDNLERNFTANSSLLSPILNISAYSRIIVQGDFPNGTNYTVDVLDPEANNASLRSGLRNGDEIPLALWNGGEVPSRSLVLRLNVNTSDASVTPVVRKWGAGTGWRGDSRRADSLRLDTTRGGMKLGVDENNYTAGQEWGVSNEVYDQVAPSIASDSKGNFVVAWQDDRNAAYDIYAKIFNPAGVPVGNEIVVSTDAIYQRLPSVAVDRNDNFIVVWDDSRNFPTTGYDIYAKVYNISTGTQVGGEITVSNVVNSQGSPAVAVDSMGNFIVAWTDWRNDPAYSDIYAKVYNISTGAQVGGEIKVAQERYEQSYAAVAADSNGNFIVTWMDNRSDTSYDISAKVYNSTGAQVGGEITVSGAQNDQLYPSVASDSKGNFVVAWQDGRNNGIFDIYAKVYNTATGAQVGGEILVSGAQYGQRYPSVTVDSKDNFVVAWQDGRSGASWDIYAKVYNISTGAQVGVEFAVSAAADDQEFPQIALDPEDNLAVAWHDSRNGPANHDIYARRFHHQYFQTGSLTTPPFSPFLHTYGSLYVDFTTPPNTGYWVNVTDENNNTLLSNLRNGDPLLVNVSQYPGIRLNLTLWTNDANATPVVSEWGYGTGRKLMFGTAPAVFEKLDGGHGVVLKKGDYTGLPEFNVTAAYDQVYPAIAADSKGNVIVTWMDFRNGNWDIYAQKFDSTGASVGGVIPVAVTAVEERGFHSIAVTPDDGFIIAWRDNRYGSWDIFAKRFDTNGSALGNDFPVTTAGNSQMGPRIGVQSGGNFIIVWQHDAIPGSSWDVRAQRFDRNGNMQGGEIAVTNRLGHELEPAIAVDSKDNFIIAWDDFRGGTYSDIYAKRFDSNGNPLGNDIAVSTAANNQEVPAVAVDSKDNFIITWHDYRGGTDYDIYAKRFDSNGNPLGNDIAVSTAANNQEWPAIAVDSKDNFIITWEAFRSGTDWDIYAKRFDSNGNPLGNDIAVSTAATVPTIAMDSKDHFIIAWNDYRSGTNYDIYARRFYRPYFPGGSLGPTYTLPVVPAAVTSSFSTVTPPSTSVTVKMRSSTDKADWSDWLYVTSNRTYEPGDFTKWGQYFQFNITMNTSDANVTPAFWDFRTNYNPYLEDGTLTGRPIIPPDGYIVSARPVVQSAIRNPQSAIAVYLSADNGTTWQLFGNDTWANFTAKGTALRWKVGLTGDGTSTPLVDGLAVNYTTESYPSDVGIDVDADGTVEWWYNDTLKGTMPATGLAAALNTYIAAHRSGAADGFLNVTVNITSRTSGVIVLGDAAIAFAPAPRVLANGPAGSDVPLNASIALSFSEAMNYSSVRDSIVITPDLSLTPFWSGDGRNLALNHSGLAANTTYNVTVRAGALSAADAPLLSDRSWVFKTRPPPAAPRVLAHGPEGPNVPLNASITISFSEAMNKSSVVQSVRILPAFTTTPAWSADGRNLTLDHGDLLANTTYNVTLRAGALSLAGGALAANDSWEFTTGPSINITPVRPSLVRVDPTGSGVRLDTAIRIEFDRKMNLGSIKGAFIITPPVNGDWTLETDGTAATFTPKPRFSPKTAYTVTLRGIVADENGSTALVNETWTFTTVSAPVSGGQPGAGFPLWLAAAALAPVLAVVAVLALRRRRQSPAPPEAAAGGVKEEEEEHPGPEAETEVPVKEKEPASPEKPAVPPAAVPEKIAAAEKTAPADFALEDVFLMYRDGRLIQHTTRRLKADMDVDIMTSMLSAVQAFVKESIGEGKDLGSMEYGESKILLDKGRDIVLAAVISGGEPQGFRDEMRACIRNIEGEFGAVLPEWDGTVSKLSGAKKFLSSLGAYRPAEQAAMGVAKSDVSIKGETEFYQGFVRLKVAVKNSMPTLIADASVRLVYNREALRHDHIEPDYPFEEGELRFGIVKPKEKKTAAFYLDPQICMESYVEGVLTYRDALDNLETVKMKKLMVSVVCPILYTDENINTAMLKRMVTDELDKKDSKLFGIPQSVPPEKAFEMGKAAVQHHDARLVREFSEKEPYLAEAWYFGKAKGREDRLVIRVRSMADKNCLEFFAASTSTLMLTGLLAELKNDLKKELETHMGGKRMEQVTAADKVEAVAAVRTLLEKAAESEAGAGETEVR